MKDICDNGELVECGRETIDAGTEVCIVQFVYLLITNVYFQ